MENNDVNATLPVGDRQPSVDENTFDSEDTNLDTGNTDLREEAESDKDELLPPEEENEARQLNVGTIFAAIFILVAVVLLIVMLAGGKKKKKDTHELDKAGAKYEVEFKEKAPAEEVAEHFEREVPPPKVEKEEDVDKILDTLPDTLQPQPEPQKAPVAPVGSGSYGSSRSDLPDTRNSKSPRKIDGLKGQASPDTNQNIVSAMINGSGFTTPSSSQRMTKEEYIAEMMKQTQNLQNQLYGSGTGSSFGSYGTGGNGNQAAAYQQNKEQFYSNGAGSGGSGEFLSYNSLWDGTIISGALITAINTDNPGVVIARVTENVYSSYDHSFLLIPEGSTLYATYNSDEKTKKIKSRFGKEKVIEKSAEDVAKESDIYKTFKEKGFEVRVISRDESTHL